MFTGVGWLVCDTSSRQIIEVKHTYPHPVTGLVSSLVLDSRTPHNPVVSKTSETNVWLSSYDHLADVEGQRGGCQHLSQRKGACFLLYKKEVD